MGSRTSKMDLFHQLLCIGMGIFLCLPVLYALSISFMQASEILTLDLHLLPDQVTFHNYMTVFTQTNMLRFLFNSFVVAFVSSVVRILTASLAAYAFAFFEFKGKRILFLFVSMTMIIPPDVLLVQNYFTVAEMKLINTYLGMMIVFFVSAMNIFIMRQNFMSYSKSLKDAAMVDGCGNFRFFSRILLPSSTPVIFTVFISSFVGTWNTYLWPLIVTNVNEMRTAQVAITMLNVADASSYGVVMAASIVILIPSLFAFFVFQRKIVSGMMAGAVKQ